MKVNNASTIDNIKRKIELLMKDKSDLDQMRLDALEFTRIRGMIVHVAFD